MIRLLVLAGLLLPPASFADGGDLFAEFCFSCHREDAEVLRSFSGTPERFQEILEGGIEDMPDFYGVFSAEEFEDLYNYVTGPAIQR